jgi:hypothetical protein
LLTCLGALVALEDAGRCALLGWQGFRARLLVDLGSAAGGAPATEEDQRAALVDALQQSLRREPGAGAATTERARKEMDRAKTARKNKQKEIKQRKLGREAAREARLRELEPLDREAREKTAAFKKALVESAADPSVALGKNLTETNAELISHAAAACELCSRRDRRWADLAAAYGVADPQEPDERMLASPWALVRGSGYQDFLSSVQELMVLCAGDHLRRALFGPWEPQDAKYSLRLDTADDRRYSLMDRDPTDKGKEPLTLWGANRLAFEALRFFPAMPTRGGMSVQGWRAGEGNWLEGCRVRWPLWQPPAGASTIHSLLGLSDLWQDGPAARSRLRGLGVYAVMQSSRVAVGDGANKKFNLTPAVPVWISTLAG